MTFDPARLTMTEIIRLQNVLSQELTRRFERPLALAFSDIVGSTDYFARFGDEAGRQLQQRHLDLLHECLPEYDGRLVDTAGDGAFTCFPGADEAAGAMIALLKALSRENVGRSRDHQLHTRVGIHWGRVLTDGVQVTGEAVNLCSRISATAEPAQIRLTNDTFYELDLAHRLACRRLGHTSLKGIARAVELMLLEWRDGILFPTTVRIAETGQELPLPAQDIISFGRLQENEGMVANDIVLTLPDPVSTKQISRWHFELRREPDGFVLRAMSSQTTEVDGALVQRGQDAPIRPDSVVRVAGVMTLTFACASAAAARVNDATLSFAIRARE
jgi:class 3 adenylate cyclase